jgi:folate-binding protein YgfZ
MRSMRFRCWKARAEMREETLASPQVQYEALRSGNGFVELFGWSCVIVAGADRQAFLNNFCTNDVKRLSPGESCEAFFTNVKGKIVGHGLVISTATELIVIGSPGQAARLIEHLDRYVIREDVQLRDATNERSVFLVTGESAASQAGTIEWRLLGNTRSGLRQTELSGRERLLETLFKNGLTECDMAAFETLRIEAGTPLFGVDFVERNLPQEIGRDRQAISFTKGCYLGQETVARIDAMGHVNQRIVGVRFDGSQVPAAGTELTHTDAKVGHVTSATLSPQLNAPLALAMVRREHQGVGSRLESSAGPCEVIALPI